MNAVSSEFKLDESMWSAAGKVKSKLPSLASKNRGRDVSVIDAIATVAIGWLVLDLVGFY